MENGISLREMGRRMDVSGVAVRKAINTGRIPADCVGVHPTNGRPVILDYERAAKHWRDNTMQGKNHAAGQRRADKIGTPRGKTGGVDDQRGALAGESTASLDQSAANTSAGQYQKARTVRETYQAKLAQLDYEEKAGELVRRDDLRVELFNASRGMRDRLGQLPDRLSGELAGMTDQHAVALMLQTEITNALEEIADAFESLASGR
jgi:hypothetical protein